MAFRWLINHPFAGISARIQLARERRGIAAISDNIYVYLSAGSKVPATHLEHVLPPFSSSMVVNNSKFEVLQPL